MDHIKTILERRLQTHKVAGPVHASQVLSYLRTILRGVLPEHTATQVRVLFYRKGIITCAAKHPGIGQEIKFQEKELLAKLQREFPQEEFLAIRITSRR